MKYIALQRGFYWLLLFNCALMAGTGWEWWQEHPQWWNFGAFLLPVVSFTGLLIHREWSIRSIRVTRHTTHSSSNR